MAIVVVLHIGDYSIGSVFGVGIEDFGLLGFGLEVRAVLAQFDGFCRGRHLLRFWAWLRLMVSVRRRSWRGAGCISGGLSGSGRKAFRVDAVATSSAGRQTILWLGTHGEGGEDLRIVSVTKTVGSVLAAGPRFLREVACFLGIWRHLENWSWTSLGAAR